MADIIDHKIKNSIYIWDPVRKKKINRFLPRGKMVENLNSPKTVSVKAEMPGESSDPRSESLIEQMSDVGKLELFLETEHEDLPVFCSLSKTFRRFCEDDINWKYRYEAEYLDKIDKYKSWKENYYLAKCLEDLKYFLKNIDIYKYTNLSLKQFYNLKKFAIPFANLNYIPKQIGCLENLETLSFYNNKISGLPKSIKNLKKLKKIVLVENKFKKIPIDLLVLPELESVHITGNPLDNSSYYGWKLVVDQYNNKKFVRIE